MFGLKPRSETGMSVAEYAAARRAAMRFKLGIAVLEFFLLLAVFMLLFALGGVAIWVRRGFEFPHLWGFVVIFGACAVVCALFVSVLRFLFSSPLAGIKR